MNASQSPVWFITGCSSGLGRQLAERALQRGYRVVAAARNPSTISTLAESAPDHCRTIALDLADCDSIRTGVSNAIAAFGRLDTIINNAGYGLLGALEELSDQQIARNFQVNFFGALEVIRAVLPLLRSQRTGHIVNISAAAAIANYPGFSIYGASKSALEAVSESLAAELKPAGITVTIVQPGPFRTDFIGRSLERAELVIPDYESSSGKFGRLLQSMDGKQAGDPSKAAEAIISALESDPPPLRLVLGKYANDKARLAYSSAERERASWEPIGLSTDFFKL